MSQNSRWGGHRPTTPSGSVAASLSGTPGLLRALIVLCVVVAITVGVVVSSALRAQNSALVTARDEAARLGDIQATSTALASADAIAANTFLIGGLEPAETRDEYSAEIEMASTTIPALAHSGTSTDAAYLNDINVDLTQYVSLVSLARANNRQGLAVGAAYLDNASTLLRTEIRPDLATLIGRGDSRVRAALDDVGVSTRIAAPLLVTLVLLLGVQVWLAIRTRRLLNPGLVVATIAVLVSGAVTVALVRDAERTALDARDGPYSVATLMSGAQAAANDAKSHESLGLIQQGSGADREAEVDRALDRAYAQIHEVNRRGGSGGSARATLDTWNQRHQSIRALDDAGDWDSAVAAATDGGPESANTAFAQFRRTAETEITSSTAQAKALLEEARSANSLALLVVVGGLAVTIGGAWWGLTRRLEEYR